MVPGLARGRGRENTAPPRGQRGRSIAFRSAINTRLVSEQERITEDKAHGISAHPLEGGLGGRTRHCID